MRPKPALAFDHAARLASAGLLGAAMLLASGLAQAAPLEFSAGESAALAQARELLSAERGEPLQADEVVRLAPVDFDGDGIVDVFAFADASYFCGSAGCIPRLYRLDAAGSWHELPLEADDMLNAEPAAWAVLPADASGWVRLELRTEALHLVFGWNGEAYMPVN